MRLSHLKAAALIVITTCLLNLAPQNNNAGAATATVTHTQFLPVITTPELPPIIPETTVPLSDQSLQYLTNVSLDGSTFTFTEMTLELAALDIGDVMVGGISSTTPNGFLRRVTQLNTVSGNLVVVTGPATLEDAIQQGGLHFSQQFTPDNATIITALPGVSVLQQIAAPTIEDAFYFEFTEVVLYDADGNSGTTNDQITMDGSFELAPTVNFDIAVEDWRLTWAEMGLSVREVAEIKISAETDLLTADLQWEVARIQLGTYGAWIGTVPVVFVAEMPIYLKVDGTISVGINTSVTQTATATAGIRYANGNWENVTHLNNDFDFEWPAFTAGANVKAYIDPPIELRLYGIAGPYVAINPYLEYDVDLFANPIWTLHGGIEANAGFIVSVLGHTIADYETSPLGYRILLASADTVGKLIEIPGYSNGTPTGIQIQQGQPFYIHASGTVDSLPDGSGGSSGGPEGNGHPCSSDCLLPSADFVTLIGKIGVNSSWFVVGRNAIIQPSDNGELFLAINDTIHSDNIGSFTVSIRPNGILVDGQSTGTSTGIVLPPGGSLSVSAYGTINTLPGPYHPDNGPDGNGNACLPTCLLPSTNFGTLIGKVGLDNDWFAIGHADNFTTVLGGELILAINDSFHDDNTGTFILFVNE